MYCAWVNYILWLEKKKISDESPLVSAYSQGFWRSPSRGGFDGNNFSDLRNAGCDRPPTWLSLVLTDDRHAASSCQLTSGRAKSPTLILTAGGLVLDESEGIGIGTRRERDWWREGGVLFLIFLSFFCAFKSSHLSCSEQIHGTCTRGALIARFNGRHVDSSYKQETHG